MNRRFGQSLVLLAVALTAFSATALLAREPVAGAFTGPSDSTGNQATASSQFCASPGSTTLTATADAWINEADQARNRGTDYYVEIRSFGPASNARGLVRFDLPALPSGCIASSATPRLYNDSPDAGRTIGVYRADPAAPWTELGVTWANQPPTVGTAPTSVTGSAGGHQTWSVLDQVRLLYPSGSNNGFLLRDESEGGANHDQYYQNRTAGNPPQLLLAWD